MKFRMDQTLKFWVDCSYEDKRHENANRTRVDLIAEFFASTNVLATPCGTSTLRAKSPGRRAHGCCHGWWMPSARSRTTWRACRERFGRLQLIPASVWTP